MELSGQQREAVQAWVAEGASLAEVQQKLKSEFNLTLTFIEVRLLVLELGVSIQEKVEPEPKQPEPQPTSDAAAVAADDDPYADAFDPEHAADATDTPDAPGDAKVSLSLDRVVVPGAMVSGDVIFSDGVKAHWMIDQMGRFTLNPATPGYRPTDADLQAFQLQLRTELQRHGYA